jgi:asparagine synthase (glutamine-hydrolysing)
MSALAGLLRVDGGRPDAGTLDRMMASLAHRGPDGAGVWISGPIAVGHQMMRTTPESLDESQPWRAVGLAVTMDGRLDNRDELRAALAARGRPPRATHDAELVLRAYECWGEGFARELIGDFAIVVWDERRRRLCCARDALGVRPFFYQWDGRTFRWGSEPHAILQDASVQRIANENMVAELLSGYQVSRDETLWSGILRLPPGHTLTLDASECRLTRYWPPDRISPASGASDTEYAERLGALLEASVRARLRAVGPVAAQLSGGIDSSAVVALGQRLVQSGAVPPRSLEAFSQTYPHRPDDEGPFAEAVAGRCGVKLHLLPMAMPEPRYAEAQVSRYLDFPEYPNSATVGGSISRAAARAGCRVMLTGVWGNSFLEGSAEHAADLLRAGRVLEAIGQTRADAALFGGRAGSILLWSGVVPLVPRHIRARLGALLRRPPILDHVPRAFARRVALRDRLREPTWTPAFPTLAQRAAYVSGLSAWNVWNAELTERGAAWHGIEERHPFADRRLVEFCLALPEAQRRRGGTLKFVLRQAMRDLVPEGARSRQSQPDYCFLFMDALAAAGGESAFQGLAVAERGWVDERRARALYRRAAALFSRGHSAYSALTWPLWTIWALELWIRATDGGEPCR